MSERNRMTHNPHGGCSGSRRSWTSRTRTGSACRSRPTIRRSGWRSSAGTATWSAATAARQPTSSSSPAATSARTSTLSPMSPRTDSCTAAGRPGDGATRGRAAGHRRVRAVRGTRACCSTWPPSTGSPASPPGTKSPSTTSSARSRSASRSGPATPFWSGPAGRGTVGDGATSPVRGTAFRAPDRPPGTGWPSTGRGPSAARRSRSSTSRRETATPRCRCTHAARGAGRQHRGDDAAGPLLDLGATEFRLVLNPLSIVGATGGPGPAAGGGSRVKPTIAQTLAEFAASSP